jgi:mono/diheme cytochrome c family protein
MTKKFLIAIAALLLATAACGGGDSGDSGDSSDGDSGTTAALTGDAASGETAFVTCAACHGPTGEGIEGLGKPMPGSAFIASLSDDELVVFIKAGRSTSDPDNTTGVDMPVKGGNPALSDQDLYDIVAFIRTLG